MGQSDLHDYTIEADLRGVSRRRQQGDMGVIAQRYALVLYGNAGELHLEPWQPEKQRTVTLPATGVASVAFAPVAVPDGTLRGTVRLRSLAGDALPHVQRGRRGDGGLVPGQVRAGGNALGACRHLCVARRGQAGPRATSYEYLSFGYGDPR